MELSLFIMVLMGRSCFMELHRRSINSKVYVCCHNGERATAYYSRIIHRRGQRRVLREVRVLLTSCVFHLAD